MILKLKKKLESVLGIKESETCTINLVVQKQPPKMDACDIIYGDAKVEVCTPQSQHKLPLQEKMFTLICSQNCSRRSECPYSLVFQCPIEPQLIPDIEALRQAYNLLTNSNLSTEEIMADPLAFKNNLQSALKRLDPNQLPSLPNKLYLNCCFCNSYILLTSQYDKELEEQERAEKETFYW